MNAIDRIYYNKNKMIATIAILFISVLFFLVFLVKRTLEKSEALKKIESDELIEKLKFSESIDYENGTEINDCG